MPPMDRLDDTQVIDGWRVNAAAWTSAVRREEIESRKLVTDAAVVQAVLERAPRRVLDLGCGEGWLSRRLAQSGCEVVGVDGIPSLIDEARSAGGATYEVATYEQLAEREFEIPFDLVVANFSLIGAEAVDGVVRRVPRWLVPGGTFAIQTVHPLVATGDQPYVTGWRPGSWAGFSSAFTDAPPWYFRTTADWITLIHRAGFRLDAMREPLHPGTGRPASLLLVSTPT